MKDKSLTRRSFAWLLAGAGVMMCAPHVVIRLAAQDQAPNRRDITILAKDFRYSPDRIEVVQDDLIRLTIRSEDIAHTFTLDEYRIAKRIPAGGTIMFEFRADRAGTFPFYCNLTSEAGHANMKGQLVVKAK